MDYTKYPKVCLAIAGTSGSDSFEKLAEETNKDPQELFNEYIGESLDLDILQEIEETLLANEAFFERWDWEIPLEGDFEEFDNLVEENESIKTLYNLIAEQDGGTR